MRRTESPQKSNEIRIKDSERERSYTSSRRPYYDSFPEHRGPDQALVRRVPTWRRGERADSYVPSRRRSRYDSNSYDDYVTVRRRPTGDRERDSYDYYSPPRRELKDPPPARDGYRDDRNPSFERVREREWEPPPYPPPPEAIRDTKIRTDVEKGHLHLASNKDLTIHFELDIGVNLEEEIEAFSQLCRLGDFRAANRYFEDHLEEYGSEDYVLISYTYMMLDMGNYRTLSTVNITYNNQFPDGEYLEDLWRWIVLHRRAHLLELDHESDYDDLTGPLPYIFSTADLQGLGSHQIKVLSLALAYRAHRGRYDPFMMTADLPFDFTTLTAQGRIWDWRDLLVAALSYNSVQVWRSYKEILGEPAADFCDRLLAHWGPKASDISTELALLDILTSLASIQVVPYPELLNDMGIIVDAAESVIASIIKFNPNALKSRQYARWLLLKVTVSTYSITDEFDNAGYSLPFETALDLPVYIPFHPAEPPTEMPKPYPQTHNEKIELALNIARDLGDYNTEALCLSRLILHSSDPHPLFDQLLDLQRKKQQDFHGALKTLLARFPYYIDAASRERLRRDLLDLGSFTTKKDKKSDVPNPDLFYVRIALLRILAPTEEEAEKWRKEASEWYSLVSTHLLNGESNDIEELKAKHTAMVDEAKREGNGTISKSKSFDIAEIKQRIDNLEKNNVQANPQEPNSSKGEDSMEDNNGDKATQKSAGTQTHNEAEIASDEPLDKPTGPKADPAEINHSREIYPATAFRPFPERQPLALPPASRLDDASSTAVEPDHDNPRRQLIDLSTMSSPTRERYRESPVDTEKDREREEWTFHPRGRDEYRRYLREGSRDRSGSVVSEVD